MKENFVPNTTLKDYVKLARMNYVEQELLTFTKKFELE